MCLEPYLDLGKHNSQSLQQVSLREWSIQCNHQGLYFLTALAFHLSDTGIPIKLNDGNLPPSNTINKKGKKVLITNVESRTT